MSKENKTKRLGKGLEALIPNFETEKISSEEESGNFVDIEKLIPNPDQPRKEFDEESLEELSASIREKGIIQPILVEKEGDKFKIVAGERRYRAAKKAELKRVPVVFGSFSEREKLEIALIENIQREALSPIEEAKAYNSLMLSGDLNQKDLEKITGKKRSTIANSMRLLKLPPEMQEALSSGDITPGHARAILSVMDPANQQLIFKKIIDGFLSVRESEKLASFYNGEKRISEKQPEKKVLKQKDPDISDAEQKFMNILGTKVELKGTLEKGKLEISYYSHSDLERLFEIIGK